MITPVRGAYGSERRPPRFLFAVAICNLKAANPGVSWNMKSEARAAEGNQPKLCDAHFRIRSVDLPQRFADFAHGGVGADGVDDVGHGVDVGNIAVGARGGSLGGGLFQGIEAALDFFVRAAGAQGFEFLLLSAGYRFADVENVAATPLR